MRMRHVDIQRLLLPTLDHTLFFFFGIQQNVTRPDPRNIYSNWYGLINTLYVSPLVVHLHVSCLRVSSWRAHKFCYHHEKEGFLSG